jgi:penicillin-insensitive murein endopeptidase
VVPLGTVSRLVIGTALLTLVGCVGVPSPLAPGLSGSVGLPHHGVLAGGSKLPQSGPGFRRLRKDGVRWAHSRLVEAVQRAAARVAELRPGPKLVIGDLSAEGGGQIPRHRSHRSGRDADLLFYVMTPAGRSIDNSGFPRFGADLLAKTDRAEQRFVRLDVERNWLLVRELVSDPDARVQWLFVAHWIEALLIEHARALGEDDELVWRAEQVLRQPGDSFPHDDHLHLRIACSPEDEAAGCFENGPRWPWLERPSAVQLSDAELLAALFDDAANDTGAETSKTLAAPQGAP